MGQTYRRLGHQDSEPAWHQTPPVLPVWVSCLTREDTLFENLSQDRHTYDESFPRFGRTYSYCHIESVFAALVLQLPPSMNGWKIMVDDSLKGLAQAMPHFATFKLFTKILFHRTLLRFIYELAIGYVVSSGTQRALFTFQ